MEVFLILVVTKIAKNLFFLPKKTSNSLKLKTTQKLTKCLCSNKRNYTIVLLGYYSSMTYRKLNRINDKIIEQTQLLGGKKGLAQISTKEIATACRISEYTIFQHFKTKKNLLYETALSFDRKAIEKVLFLLNNGSSNEAIWDNILDYFIKQKNGTLYYAQYIAAIGLDASIDNPRSSEFLPVGRKVLRNSENYSDQQIIFMWDYLLLALLYYAGKIIRNHMPNSEEYRSYIRSVVFKGVYLN